MKCINVIDLECTCWENDRSQDKRMEIIEIGIVQLDWTTLEINKTQNILVKPQRTSISQYCTDLTSITEEMVQDAPYLAEAMVDITIETGDKISWVSWGDFDRYQFERECDRKFIPNTIGRQHTNIKVVIALIMGWTKSKGVARALKALDIPFEGTPHRALDDAIMVAKIMKKVIRPPRA